ncbi:tetratricopeptide repeat protein 1-like [Planoprotostelium fungivorum]|uniref:Tetratricopeptide repeat protein 1-like n=1 Tax=Planoprotostelium fungivorum TaxID=1890364 RepID=A0A2P6NCI4_9EUKA|nr:tetratricopeptide repeat protein 1-like [Planoprotostelium fungivorum]
MAADAGILQEGKRLKDEGNTLYVSKDYFSAVETYSKAIDLIEKYCRDRVEEEEEEGPRVVELTDEDVAKLELEEKEKKEREQNGESQKEDGDQSKEDTKNESIIQLENELKVPPTIRPTLSVCYHNRAAALSFIDGRNDDVIADTTRAIELDPLYVKAYLRRGKAYETDSKPEESLKDYQKALELEPSNKAAKEGITKMEPIVKDKQEKEKAEMLGKLKDVGNSFLGLFGLSTENFQMVQDPNSGGYSINFKR